MNTNYSLNLDNAVDLILNTTPNMKKYKVNLGFSKIPKRLLNLQLHKMFDRSYHTENDNFAEISVRKGNIIKKINI